MHYPKHFILLIFGFINLFSSTLSAQKKFDPSKLKFIDNGTIKLGVSPDLGGAITYISKSKNGKNIINNWDWGRQIQMSFFAYPMPYTEKGQTPKDHWKHIGWNPIQAGDDFGNGSKVIALEKTKTSLYVKCIPMQWPLNNVPGECTYECWIELKGNTVQVKAQLNNARSDTTQYKAKHQELPAVYTNGEYYRLMTYRGTKPFTGDKISRIPKKTSGGFAWNYWLATENWAALVNDEGWGLGIYKDKNYLFIGGFAGEEGKGETTDSPTGYIAPLQTEIIDHNITYTYNYSLILGHLEEIRNYAVEQGQNSTNPDWTFEKDRQNWYYHADKHQGVDAGWPIHGFIELDLSKKGMTAISPPTVWQAKDAPTLFIEAAFKTDQKQAMVAWTPYSGTENFLKHSKKNSTTVKIQGDGQFRTYKVHLSDVPTYKGAMCHLMLKPTSHAEKGAWAKIKRIWFDDQKSVE